MTLNLSAGTVIADRFRLVRRLGQGGMGSVWLAQHTRLDVPCAIKFTHEKDATSPVIQARFEREAKIAAQLRSPHVVQILDHGSWNAVPYIAMELLEGEDLSARLHRLGKLDPQQTAAIVSHVARALTKAHAAGLIHRDLKPANIFIVHDDDREIVKVLDFGIAKSALPAASEFNTTTGSVMGTPHYLSPEQAIGTKVYDHRADLWALGVVVFRCLTGRLPFPGEAIGELLMKIMVEPIPVPSEIAKVPPGFDAWWQRASARDPEQRFQSARELSDALIEALDLQDSSIDTGMSSMRLPSLPAAKLAEIEAASLLAASTGKTASAVSFNGATNDATGGPKLRRSLAIPMAITCLLLGGGLAFLVLGRAPPSDEVAATSVHPPDPAAPAPGREGGPRPAAETTPPQRSAAPEPTASNAPSAPTLRPGSGGRRSSPTPRPAPIPGPNKPPSSRPDFGI